MSEVDLSKTGVYQWRNKVNGKVYVGSASISFERRRIKHVTELRSNTHANSHLQRAWHAYGEDAFVFEILHLCEQDDCIKYEQHWIDKKLSADPLRGYNLTPTAGSVRGIKRRPETIAKMRIAAKKRGVSQVTRDASIKANTGRKQSDEHRRKLSESQKHVEHTAERNAKISKALTGIKRSAESIAKMVAKKKGIPAWNKGKKLSPEHAAKCRLARLGKPPSNKGVPASESRKAKMLEAWIRRRQKYGANGIANIEAINAKRNATRAANKLKNPGKKMTHRLAEDQVVTIWQRLMAGDAEAVIARDFGVAPQTINSIRHGKTWRRVTGILK